METLKVVSMNVNGINSPTKRRVIFNYFRKQKADVYLIQETHASECSEKIWRQEWGGPAYFSNGTSGSRGVAVLMDRNLQFRVVHSIKDQERRLLCLDVEIRGIIFTIATIYAPTQDKGKHQLKFLSQIDTTLAELKGVNILLGGDFNHCICPFLDRNSSKALPGLAETVGHSLTALLDEWGLSGGLGIQMPRVSPFTEGLMHHALTTCLYPLTSQRL